MGKISRPRDLLGEGVVEVVEGDGTDLLQAVPTDVFHGVVGRVPVLVGEIDEVNGGDAGDVVERFVVVFDLAVEVAEIFAHLEGIGVG